MADTRILVGDVRKTIVAIPDRSVHCIVTSPPYYGLRDYGHDNQIGIESTPESFTQALVDVFRECRRILRDDGTLWLNIGDSYESKQLLGIPWRVAFALQADGWWLRQDIIWHKPNPMPESVTDRCTKAHEYLFLLSKSDRYRFDRKAISESSKYPNDDRKSRSSTTDKRMPTDIIAGVRPGSATYETRNRRSVWTVATQPYLGAHFATFPPALIEPCILAGCPKDGIVFDPFGGAGTTGLVASRLGRSSVFCELNSTYAEMAAHRIKSDSPMFNHVKVEPPNG